MKNNQEKCIPIIEGFENLPGEELIIEIELKHIPIAVIEEIFKGDLTGKGMLPITGKYENALYEKIGIKLNTKKLRFFIGLYRVD